MIIADRRACLIQGDTVEVLAQLPALVTQCCVTSPPYWGLRDYGLPPTQWPDVTFTPMAGLPPVTVPAWSGCLGLEIEPLAFVAHLVHVFREVRRVLADDGTLWLNLGDSYASSGRGGSPTEESSGLRGGQESQRASTVSRQRQPSAYLKPKDLIGIPWRVALALQADGWYLRSDCIWAKPNPMPESVTDRPTKAHEYVFLFSKSAHYFYDAGAVKEPDSGAPAGNGFNGRQGGSARVGPLSGGQGSVERWQPGQGRNARSVWNIAAQPYKGAHFATMPRDLAMRCLLAGSKPHDFVLDPFSGAGTTGVSALNAGRRYLGVELRSEYIALSIARLSAPVLR